MDDVPELRKTFGRQLEDMIIDRQVQLTPLQSGDMRVAYRSGVNGSWVDNTDAQAQRLRTEISNMQAIADHLREDGV